MTATPETDRKLRLTRTHVYALLNAGLLGDRHFELLSGELIQKMPQGKPHVDALRATVDALESVFTRPRVGSQTPVIVNETNEPEPDAFVVRADFSSYADNPEARDVLLVVEISDATLSVDRGEKMRLYAGAGISEYWIVDVNGRRVIVHRNPQSDGYGSIETLVEADFVRSLAAPDHEIAVASLLA